MTFLIDCGVVKNCSVMSCNFIDLACFSEMMTPVYHTAWHHILTDSKLLIHPCDIFLKHVFLQVVHESTN
jgi:hypothetical protein